LGVGVPGFLRARGRGFGASSVAGAGSAAVAGADVGTSAAGVAGTFSGIGFCFAETERPGAPPFCARNAGAFAGLARSAATFSA